MQRVNAKISETSNCFDLLRKDKQCLIGFEIYIS